MTEEPRALDVLRDLPVRAVVGDRLGARVGARGWCAPRFAKGRRLFSRCGLPDPWDPDAPDVPIPLGEVGIAAPRRAPAPHASPPGLAAKPAATVAPRLPPSGEKPAPRVGESRADDTAALKRKLAEKERVGVSPESQARARVNQPVARLPVRPEIAAKLQAEAAARAAVAEAIEPTPVARPPVGNSSPGAASPPETPLPSAPPHRAPSAGLDDLFGMGGGESRPRPTATEPTSRRPRVTENPLADGIDRRPPPPKPPKP